MAKKEKTSSMQLEPIEVTAEGGEYYSMNDIYMVGLEVAETIEDYHAQLSHIIKKFENLAMKNWIHLLKSCHGLGNAAADALTRYFAM